MAGTWNIAPQWSVTLVFLTYVYMCWGCTPPDGIYSPPPTEEKLHFSDIFAYGKATDIYQGGYMYKSMYTVHFEIYCTFKGDPLPKMINITRAGKNVEGYEPGLCISNNFEKGKKYFVYLNDDLTPRYSEDVIVDVAELDDIPLFCDVNINYPKDVDENDATVQCPDPYPEYADRCMDYVPTTTQPDSVVVKTMAPKGGDNNMPADGTPDGTAEGTPEGTPEGTQTGQAISLEDDGGAGERVIVSLGLMALCVILAVF